MLKARKNMRSGKPVSFKKTAAEFLKGEMLRSNGLGDYSFCV